MGNLIIETGKNKEVQIEVVNLPRTKSTNIKSAKGKETKSKCEAKDSKEKADLNIIAEVVDAMAGAISPISQKNQKENQNKAKKAKAEEPLTPKKSFVLNDVQDENAFYSADGSRLMNLKHLAEALDTMHEDTYISHANDQKNDFSNWIKEVIEEHELAENINGKTQKEAHVEVLKHIVSELTTPRS
ncbi:hypothetical protein ACFL0W_03720 [Nanoarchaeota archaeon]